ncbi:MAG: tRNA (adenosine(37)-N6)-dimethylallyltransferase MiaA, partial [Candidatus Brocadiae bacterium]|nr:tRNA (adenosine(37)-N6)-dimethylallyltransferase MiaA [Candidatus Brocadiia bacterium]
GRLALLDPEAARRIHPNDVQRLVRALEVCELTGSPISAGQEQFAGEPRLEHAMVGLRWPRARLYRRIERRVDAMMERGLKAEVESLRGKLGPQACQALAYKELAEHLDGRMDLAQAVSLIKRNTRRLAKHQLTWFRHFPQVQWVDAQECRGASELADRCDAVFGRPA